MTLVLPNPRAVAAADLPTLGDVANGLGIDLLPLVDRMFEHRSLA